MPFCRMDTCQYPKISLEPLSGRQCPCVSDKKKFGPERQCQCITDKKKFGPEGFKNQ